jgi:hypothetical protein
MTAAAMSMVEAQPIGPVAAGAEPLPFLTLASVEGIIRSIKVGSALEQTTWNDKVEKSMHLSAAYSSDRMVSGERCYVIEVPFSRISCLLSQHAQVE